MEIIGAEAEAIKESLSDHSDDGIGRNAKISLLQPSKFHYVAEYIQNNCQVKSEGDTLQQTPIVSQVANGVEQLPNLMSTLPVTTTCITASDQTLIPSQVISSIGITMDTLATTFSPSTSVKETAKTT